MLIYASAIAYAATTAATPLSGYAPPDQQSNALLKPVAVIYFKGPGSHSADYSDAMRTMILESGREFKIAINEYALNSEDELAATIDSIADEETGMIVIIEPHKLDALIKIPSLYPDIYFSIIGAQDPMYIINVNSMLFKEQEGTFISGALAALHSKNGIISFLSKEDVPSTRNLAYAYYQGAKYINPDIQVIQQLGTRHMFGTSTSSPAMQHQLTKGKSADIVFVQDDELLDTALRQAKEQKQLVIAPSPHAMEQHQGIVLTGLLKHYDLALYAALRSYATRSWAPTTQNIGLGNGYIDYVVDYRNRALFSKDQIERIERTKDLVAQGILKISPLQ